MSLIEYENYIIIAENNDKETKKLKDQLTMHFLDKNLRPLEYFLVIKVTHLRKRLLIT